MNIVFAVTLTLIAAAGLLTLVRLLRGPRALDRILALDVLVTLAIAATAVSMTVRDDTSAVPVLLVLALLAFIGSVTAAHLIEEREGMR
ncbi:monovalent cation/H+ antiporter complex subunit F [Streptomyces sp. CRN 30]|uniref:monovalent cation/H+ antiporter complex subunit F n=1 Tax=Streptomyces sp. CRN 30 TaxID=3075613 RepID=UPI002A81F74F|nr:monovalent cation/H+ antiporter complex subunit F [Streptomyces sp. CRN 30]